MKLTDDDKELLRQWGEEEIDFEYIEKAIEKTIYTLYSVKDNKTVRKIISAKEAIELLGREDFLSGIARSAFHWDAVQETEDGREIEFDSSRLFG